MKLRSILEDIAYVGINGLAMKNIGLAGEIPSEAQKENIVKLVSLVNRAILHVNLRFPTKFGEVAIPKSPFPVAFQLPNNTPIIPADPLAVPPTPIIYPSDANELITVVSGNGFRVPINSRSQTEVTVQQAGEYDYFLESHQRLFVSDSFFPCKAIYSIKVREYTWKDMDTIIDMPSYFREILGLWVVRRVIISTVTSENAKSGVIDALYKEEMLNVTRNYKRLQHTYEREYPIMRDLML